MSKIRVASLLMICGLSTFFIAPAVSQVSAPKIIEGKPTFEQTFEFIQNNYNYRTSYSGYSKQDKALAVLDFSHLNISYKPGTDTILMSVNWKFESSTVYSNTRKTHHLYQAMFEWKDIERIEPIRWTQLNGLVNIQTTTDATFPYGIRFHAVSAKPLIRLYSSVDFEAGKTEDVSSFDLFFGKYSNADNIEAILRSFQESQIFKAFDHMRKLAGAPEPLKF